MAEGSLTAPAFVGDLVAALERELPGAEVRAEHIRAHRYRFVVVWDQFDQMGHPERQRKVWDIADGVVDRKDLLDVGMILTLGRQDLPGAGE